MLGQALLARHVEHVQTKRCSVHNSVVARLICFTGHVQARAVGRQYRLFVGAGLCSLGARNAGRRAQQALEPGGGLAELGGAHGTLVPVHRGQPFGVRVYHIQRAAVGSRSDSRRPGGVLLLVVFGLARGGAPGSAKHLIQRMLPAGVERRGVEGKDARHAGLSKPGRLTARLPIHQQFVPAGGKAQQLGPHGELALRQRHARRHVEHQHCAGRGGVKRQRDARRCRIEHDRPDPAIGGQRDALGAPGCEIDHLQRIRSRAAAAADADGLARLPVAFDQRHVGAITGKGVGRKQLGAAANSNRGKSGQIVCPSPDPPVRLRGAVPRCSSAPAARCRPGGPRRASRAPPVSPRLK